MGTIHLSTVINICNTMGIGIFLGLILYSVGQANPSRTRLWLGIAATALIMFSPVISAIMTGMGIRHLPNIPQDFIVMLLLFTSKSLLEKIGVVLFCWGILAALDPESRPDRKIIFGGLAGGALVISIFLGWLIPMMANS